MKWCTPAALHDTAGLFGHIWLYAVDVHKSLIYFVERICLHLPFTKSGPISPRKFDLDPLKQKQGVEKQRFASHMVGLNSLFNRAASHVCHRFKGATDREREREREREKYRGRQYYSNLNQSDGTMNQEQQKISSVVKLPSHHCFLIPWTPSPSFPLFLAVSITLPNAVSMAILMGLFDKVTFTREAKSPREEERKERRRQRQF